MLTSLTAVVKMKFGSALMRVARRTAPLVAQNLFGDDRTIMLAAPMFSPDGRRVAYQRNGHKPVWPLRIWISQTAGGPPVLCCLRQSRDIRARPHGRPTVNGSRTDWTDREWRLAKVRVGSDRPIILRSDGIPNATPAWSPTGDWITWATRDGFRSSRLMEGSAYSLTSIGSPTLVA